jgi:hypothetical protein
LPALPVFIGYFHSAFILLTCESRLFTSNIPTARPAAPGGKNGYKNHPPLNRFKESKNPFHRIDQYPDEIFKEAERRNHSFFFSRLLKVT